MRRSQLYPVVTFEIAFVVVLKNNNCHLPSSSKITVTIEPSYPTPLEIPFSCTQSVPVTRTQYVFGFPFGVAKKDHVLLGLAVITTRTCSSLSTPCSVIFSQYCFSSPAIRVALSPHIICCAFGLLLCEA